MGIGQVSHCQAQPVVVGLKQGASDGWHYRATPTFAGVQAEGLCQVWMELIKSFCHHARRHCHALCPHFTMGRIFPTEIAPSRGPGDRAVASHLLVGVLTTLLWVLDDYSFSQCEIVRSVLH